MPEAYKTGDADKSAASESQKQGTNCKEVNIPSIFLLCTCKRGREKDCLCATPATARAHARNTRVIISNYRARVKTHIIATSTIRNYNLLFDYLFANYVICLGKSHSFVSL